MSQALIAKVKLSGSTPTIVCVRAPSTMRRPMTFGSPASLPRQNALVTIATGRPTSSGSNVRPRIGVRPSSGRNPGVTSFALTRSAAPSSVIVRFVPSNASIAARDPARARQASKTAYPTARGAAAA